MKHMSDNMRKKILKEINKRVILSTEFSIKFAKKLFLLSIFLLIYLRHIDLKFILKKLYI